MIDYFFNGVYDWSNIIAPFEGYFMRDEHGNILGELKLGENGGDYYDISGKFIPFKKSLLLEFFATGKKVGRWGEEVPLDCQFIKHGSTDDFLGSFGGGIKIADENIIQAIKDGKNPLRIKHEIWVIHRALKNSNLTLRLTN